MLTANVTSHDADGDTVSYSFQWKKNGEPRQLFLGIALMAYGYFVTNVWWSLAVGAVLTLLLFFPQ